jgi:hypothetical protein
VRFICVRLSWEKGSNPFETRLVPRSRLDKLALSVCEGKNGIIPLLDFSLFDWTCLDSKVNLISLEAISNH